MTVLAHAATTVVVTEPRVVTNPSGPRIAVYLDCSNSMESYLAGVEAEIRKQFPDADVFSVPHIKVWVDGTVVRGGGDLGPRASSSGHGAARLPRRQSDDSGGP